MVDRKKPLQVTITEADLATWQKEFQELQQQQLLLNQKLMAIHQKIQIATVLLGEQRAKNGDDAPQLTQSQHVQNVQGSTTFFIPLMPGNPQPSQSQAIPAPKAPPLSDMVMSLFATGEERLTKLEIKKLLKNKGVGTIGANNAYFYTLMKRLVDKNLLAREGEIYRRNI